MKHWLTVKSLRPGAEVQIADLDEVGPAEAPRSGRHAKVSSGHPPLDSYDYSDYADSLANWADEDTTEEPRGCPVGHTYRPS